MNSVETFRQTTPRQNPRGLVDKLKAEATTNPVFNAVCTQFAMRERARRQVTVASLKATMMAEGFDYKPSDYERVLRFLSDQGVGKLELTDKGAVKALVDIKVTLQSIGKAAVGEKEVVSKLKRGPKIKPLEVAKPQPAPVPKPEAKVTPAPKATEPAPFSKRSYNAKIVMVFDNLPVEFELPKLTTSELTELIEEIKSRKSTTQ